LHYRSESDANAALLAKK